MHGVKTFTIVTKSYLAYAKGLAFKVNQLHPDASFTIFVVDPEGMGDAATGTKADIRSAADLFEDDTFRLMTGYYTADELCNACKPWAHAALLGDNSTNTTLYLDSDIFLMGSLAPLLNDLGEKAILLTPHVFDAQADHGCEGLYRALLQGGIYNGGCLVLSHSHEADSFLDWWKSRLKYECLRDVPSLCVDQPWLNFILAFYSSEAVAVCRRPGVNVGHWNMHERELRLTAEGEFTANGEPLLFLHFSGWDWQNPRAPSRHAITKAAKSSEAWSEAGELYAKLLINQGIEQSSQLKYTYGCATSGAPITVEMRRRFLDHVKAGNATSHHSGSPTVFTNPEMFMTMGPIHTEKSLASRAFSKMKSLIRWRPLDTANNV
jgi:hypothetical protein